MGAVTDSLAPLEQTDSLELLKVFSNAPGIEAATIRSTVTLTTRPRRSPRRFPARRDSPLIDRFLSRSAIPGREKVTSIEAPPIIATVMPAMVRTGSRALGSPWRSTTCGSLSLCCEPPPHNHCAMSARLRRKAVQKALSNGQGAGRKDQMADGAANHQSPLLMQSTNRIASSGGSGWGKSSRDHPRTTVNSSWTSITIQKGGRAYVPAYGAVLRNPAFLRTGDAGEADVETDHRSHDQGDHAQLQAGGSVRPMIESTVSSEKGSSEVDQVEPMLKRCCPSYGVVKSRDQLRLLNPSMTEPSGVRSRWTGSNPWR